MRLCMIRINLYNFFQHFKRLIHFPQFVQVVRIKIAFICFIIPVCKQDLYVKHANETKNNKNYKIFFHRKIHLFSQIPI